MPTVLIVDDNAALREVLRAYLERERFRAGWETMRFMPYVFCAVGGRSSRTLEC